MIDVREALLEKAVDGPLGVRGELLGDVDTGIDGDSRLIRRLLGERLERPSQAQCLQRHRAQLVDQAGKVVDLLLETNDGAPRRFAYRIGLAPRRGGPQRRGQLEPDRGQLLERLVMQLVRPVMALPLGSLHPFTQAAPLDGLGGGHRDRRPARQDDHRLLVGLGELLAARLFSDV